MFFKSLCLLIFSYLLATKPSAVYRVSASRAVPTMPCFSFFLQDFCLLPTVSAVAYVARIFPLRFAACNKELHVRDLCISVFGIAKRANAEREREWRERERALDCRGDKAVGCGAGSCCSHWAAPTSPSGATLWQLATCALLCPA